MNKGTIAQRVKVPALPDHLERNFIFHDFRLVRIKHLYAGLITLTAGRNMRYLPVTETPHYIFARHILKGDPLHSVHGYREYGHYIAVNRRHCTEKAFMQVIHDIQASGYDWENRPIFVFRHWRRPLPFGRWDVGDGLHRLAVLAALGEKEVNVATLRSKYDIFEQLIRRLGRGA